MVLRESVYRFVLFLTIIMVREERIHKFRPYQKTQIMGFCWGDLLLLTYLIMNYFLFVFVWCPCMAIDNVSVQHYGRFSLGVILLTQCYYHRGTRLNAMERFCICSL